MALLEAMANGLAVVATDMGGVPDVLTDGVDGVVVPPEDPDSLASAIRSLVDRPDRRTELAAAARARAEELGEVQVAARLDAIYQELALA
jgi:glycosyltransferase involved in cell wall biosynthesis